MTSRRSAEWLRRHPLTNVPAEPRALPPADAAWNARRDAVCFLRELSHLFARPSEYHPDRRIMRALRRAAGQIDQGHVGDVPSYLVVLAQQHEQSDADEVDVRTARVLRRAAEAITRADYRLEVPGFVVACEQCGAELAEPGAECLDCKDAVDLEGGESDG